MQRRRPMLLISVLVLLLAGCAAGNSPQLHKYSPGSGGASQLIDAMPNSPYAFDDLTMCVEGEGAVTITKVEPVEPAGGFSVQAFSVLPSRAGAIASYVEDNRESLESVGYPLSGKMVVDTQCPAQGEEGTNRNYTRLGIEVSWSGGDWAGTTRGIRVTYESSDGTHDLDYPFAIGLCNAAMGDPASPSCSPTPISMD